jgi:TP901 family phage tail tape measure protein
MADVNANIGVNIDTSLALTQLKSLQRQISQFHTSIARSSETAALAQKSLQKNFLNSVNAIGSFSAELRTVKTTTESFTSSLEGNKFSMREYFRYAGGATKTFGKLFKSEFDTIGRVAEERVKRLQTQYIKMGRDASGAMQAISITPTSLDMDNYGTKTAIAAQKQALFNQLMKQGSTNLLNFGKNTQWAGRQLMVGFTIPLAMVGSAATRTFMDMEAQALKFRKVYGDLFTPKEETQQALDNITELGKSFTKYGVAVSTTVGLAAEAAAAGFSGLDLQRQTTEATRLSILGQLDSQKALETTISLQNAFGMSSEKLADSINFLNAVENQTVVSLDDITTAIPKVAPVIQQLGGDVKDLTFFLAAMKEGGINASEGANALKSGLAALINPTGRASAMLEGFGINARKIVTDNKGNLKATVVEFATALNQLDPLNRAQAIEQMFGKFQFARLSTLFANVAKDGNQAARVLDLANSSVEELSALSEQELGMTADSAMNKFKKTVEDLKAALIPVGKAFLEAVTPIVEFVGNILQKFSDLSAGTKKAITLMVTIIGGLGPIFLMTFGLLANGVANIIKLFLTLRNGYLRLTGQSQMLGEQTQYLTMEQIDAAAASHSLNQAHATLTQQFTAESAAINQLIAAYQGATRAGAAFAMANPGAMLPKGKGYADGVISVPGSGNKDTVPAMLTPGEAVIPAAMAKKYAPLISGMVSGNIPGYRLGRKGREASGGELAQRNVMGGYDLSHIGGIITRTGQELLQLAENQTQNTKRLIEKLVQSSEDGLNTIFDVLDNRITVQSKELNQTVGETGSGKKAPIELFKRDAVERAAAFNAPILVQMEEAGASQEELQSSVSEITEAITSGLEDLSGQTTITAEEIDNLVKKAYTVVGETNAKVKDAYTKMQDPGALKEVAGTGVFGRQGLRGGYNTPTQKKKVSAMVQKMSPETYPTQQAFVFTGEAARKVGIQNAEEIAKIFDQLSKEAKMRVQALLGDINAMSAQVVAEAQSAGIDMGKSVITGVAVGAKTASPSKDTIKTGEDIGKGLEIGMESRKDDVAKVGTTLGKTATQSTSRGASTGVITPGQPYNIQRSQGGVTVGQVAAGAPISPDIKEKVIEQARVTQTATDRLRSLDKNIMGASFAISSLSGFASMSGGALGNMAGVISKVTGAMFALQAVTGLLTQTKLLEHVASRANLVAQGMGATGFKGLLVGVAGFGKKLLTITKFLGRFAGPIGALITVLTGSISIFKVLDGVRKREIEQITGLSNAMATTTEQVKTLGDFFGVAPSKLPFELGKGREIASPQVRSQRESLKSSAGFQQQFAQTIKTLSTATAAEAQLAFTSLALNLKAQGFATDQIQTIIDALREEAGKTDVVLDVKSLNFSEESIQNLQNQISSVFVDFQKNVKIKPTGMDKFLSGFIGGLLGEQPKLKEFTTATEKSLSQISTFMSETAKSSAGMFQLGLIDATTYTNSLNGIIGMTKNLDETNRKLILTKVFESLGAGAGALLGSLKSARQEMMALALLSSGVLDKDSLIFKALGSKDARTRGRGVAQLTKQYNELTAAVTKATQEPTPKPYVPPATDGTGKDKLTLADMIKKNKEFVTNIDNQNKALTKLTAQGLTVAEAMEIVTDAEQAAVIAGTNIKKSNEEWKKYITTLKNAEKALLGTKEGAKEASDAASSSASSYFSAQEALVRSQRQAEEDILSGNIKTAETEVENVQKQIDAQQAFIDANNENISKLNNRIDLEYDRKIQALNDEASILQNNLTLIDQQTEAINAKYDAQADALNKISEINSEIASQQKQQIGLADALSRGDIAAAASAAQEMRAQAAASRIGGTQAALEAARTQQLSGVTSGGMTREQIDQRLFVINQQTFALEQSRKTLQTEVVALQDSNYRYELAINKIKKDSLIPAQGLVDAAKKNLEDYILITQKQIDGLTYLGLTSKEWENNKIKVDAAYESISATETSLGNSKTAAKTIFDLWDSIKSKTITIATNYTSTGSTGSSNFTYGAGNPLFKTKMYGGKIMPMNYGGMVPKYMAVGGKVGSDTVPAMLTPGEFVMNKAATKRFGPMLENMNNSKYPSMIKDLTPTTYTSVNSSISMPVSSNLSSTVNDNSSTMYNYNVGINVNESNASSNDIARAVIGQIKYIDSQRIRGQR